MLNSLINFQEQDVSVIALAYDPQASNPKGGLIGFCVIAAIILVWTSGNWAEGKSKFVISLASAAGAFFIVAAAICIVMWLTGNLDNVPDMYPGK